MSGANPVIGATPASGHFHAVRFYENERSLCRIVAGFLGEGLAMGQPGLVVATPEHRRGILDELRVRHFDVVRLHAAGDLVMVDARKVMSGFIVDGVPDARLFTESTTRVLERTARGREALSIRGTSSRARGTYRCCAVMRWGTSTRTPVSRASAPNTPTSSARMARRSLPTEGA
jgi:hypothetical protein